MLHVLSARRSIRKFADRPVEKELIESIIHAATVAPSGKNRQPWEFIVLTGTAKSKVADLVEAGAERAKESGIPAGSAKNSARVMREAAYLVMVYNPLWQADAEHSGVNRYMYSVDTQSLGAAIQNMLLQAQAYGLGSLWICDVFYAERELAELLRRSDELVAAVAIGYPDEVPDMRPRKPVAEVTRWLEEV
ncbi:MAG: nitroreductase [Firmicutes bacterium]|nr:nitroreductase [Bacillota bacterium]